MKIGSLFSGIGGLEVGLARAFVEAGLDVEVCWQVERDEFARGVLAMHFPKVDRSVTDVREANASNLANVDLICGGFPCQDLSYAGRGAGLDGARSGLWAEYARIVGALAPSFVVVENVAALVTRGLDRVVRDLDGIGYDVEGRIVGADDVGAPHRRRRIFLLAYRRNLGREELGASRLHGRGPSGNDASRRRASVADADALGSEGRARPSRAIERQAAIGGGRSRADVADARRARLEGTDLAAPKDAEPSRRRARSVDGVGRCTLPDAERVEVRVERERVPGGRARGVRARGNAEPRLARESAGRAPESRMGRGPHGLSDWLDRWPCGPGDAPALWEPARTIHTFAPTWEARLTALGNAVVPAVARLVGERVVEVMRERGLA